MSSRPLPMLSTNPSAINDSMSVELNIKDYSIIQGDCLEVLKTLPEDSVDLCVTSPPYYGLRSYHAGDREIGQEESPPEYVKSLADVFDEVRRVLKPTGTLWLNLGDTYNGTKNGNTEVDKNPTLASSQDGLHKKEWKGLPNKSLLGIPWRVAFALQDRGWILRNDIIWDRPNSMPDSAPDRVSRAHEYIFMFSKRPSGYFFDYESIMEDAVGAANEPMTADNDSPLLIEVEASAQQSYDDLPDDVKAHYKNLRDEDKGQQNHSFHKRRAEGKKDVSYQKRRKRDVWRVPSHGFAEAHFATYPEKLIEPCVLAGCPKGGLVLDPFNGAATTGVVALKNRRRYLGIELNPEYIEISHKRIAKETAQTTFDF